MVKALEGFWDKLILVSALRRWRGAMSVVDKAGPAALRRLQRTARRERHAIDDLLHRIEGQLSGLVRREGDRKHPAADWIWRPQVWTGPLSVPGLVVAGSGSRFSDEISVFHDCTQPEIILHQKAVARATEARHWALDCEVFRFDGSFLSLALALPNDALQGLTRRHLLQLQMALQFERPMRIYARLNIQNGPNLAQITEVVEVDGEEATVVFDLFGMSMNEKRLEKAWLDLILDVPQCNRLVVHDLVMNRYPRAEM